MYKRVISSLILISYATSSLACDKPVAYLQKGEAAPCTGYLFSPEKERELRLLDQDHKLLQQENELKDRVINNYKIQVNNLETIATKEAEKAELWRNKAEDSTKKFMQEEEGRGRRDWLFLVSGIVLTVAAGFAVGQASK